jgi:hypothetical protein
VGSHEGNKAEPGDIGECLKPLRQHLGLGGLSHFTDYGRTTRRLHHCPSVDADPSDVVITMGCGDTCPFYQRAPAKRAKHLASCRHHS